MRSSKREDEGAETFAVMSVRDRSCCKDGFMRAEKHSLSNDSRADNKPILREGCVRSSCATFGVGDVQLQQDHKNQTDHHQLEDGSLFDVG